MKMSELTNIYATGSIDTLDAKEYLAQPDIIKAFTTSTCTFQTIRADLATNPMMSTIMSAVRNGAQFN